MKPPGKAERDIHREAEALRAQGVSAVAFSARVFGPEGLLRRLWKTEADRRRMAGSELYARLHEILAELRGRDAAEFDREVEALSGRLTVVVPKSLHAALKREASQEGISLSELIRLKLGISYRDVAEHLVARDRAASPVKGRGSGRENRPGMGAPATV